jgi:CO/xanthine dehydrogenase Mo-binding subunit
MIARAMQIDPVEFRRRNILREGRPQATGTLMRDAAIDLVLERLAARMNWSAPFDRGAGTIRRGRGIAIGFKAAIAPTTSAAIVTLAADGSCTVAISTVDMGQGSDTIMAQVAAEVLNVPLEAVRIVHPDTDVTPYDMATLGSRSTYHMGHAVRLAAEDARAKLAALADESGLPANSNLPPAEIFRRKYGMQAGTIVGSGSFVPEYASPDHHTGLTANATPYWMPGGTGAEIEIDTETGQLRVTRLINVADAGTPINPRLVDTQLSGGAIMQLGFTLTEEMMFRDGQLINPSLADYKIPGFRDLPLVIENEAVAAREHGGPFGAKGVGESATFGVSPAIANAIEDAIGVRLTALPLKPEAILRALRAQAGRPLLEER